MAKTYYGYKRREGLQPIDYLGATKDLTAGLTGIFEEREKEREVIEEEVRKAEEEAKDVPMGDSSTLNEMVLDSSNGAAEALRVQAQLMRNGVIRPSEYTKFKQNTLDGVKDLKEGAASLNKNITDAKAAIDAGTASVSTMTFMEDAMKNTWFDRTRMYTDPKTGHLMIVRTDEKGKDVDGSETTMRNFKNQTKQIINRYDVEKETSSFTKTLGEDVRLALKDPNVKTIKDALQKVTIDPETGEEYTNFQLIDQWVESITDADAASILVDELGGKYSATGDVNEKGKAGKVYYKIDPTAANKNTRTADLTPEQRKAAKEYLKRNIYAQLDYVETPEATAGTSATERKAAEERTASIRTARTNVSNLKKIFEGKSDADVNQALSTYNKQLKKVATDADGEFIKAQVSGKGDERKIEVVYRNKFGDVISEKVADIPENFQDFVDAAGTTITGDRNILTLREEAMAEIDDPSALTRGDKGGAYEVKVLEEQLPAVDTDATLSDAMDAVESELDTSPYDPTGILNSAYTDMSTAAEDMFKVMDFGDYSITKDGDNILITVDGYNIPSFNTSIKSYGGVTGGGHGKRRTAFKKHMEKIYTALTTGKKAGGSGNPNQAP